MDCANGDGAHNILFERETATWAQCSLTVEMGDGFATGSVGTVA